jgi:hypothetical protein
VTERDAATVTSSWRIQNRMTTSACSANSRRFGLCLHLQGQMNTPEGHSERQAPQHGPPSQNLVHADSASWRPSMREQSKECGKQGCHRHGIIPEAGRSGPTSCCSATIHPEQGHRDHPDADCGLRVHQFRQEQHDIAVLQPGCCASSVHQRAQGESGGHLTSFWVATRGGPV